VIAEYAVPEGASIHRGSAAPDLIRGSFKQRDSEEIAQMVSAVLWMGPGEPQMPGHIAVQHRSAARFGWRFAGRAQPQHAFCEL
jgi:hypothetical protein